MFHRIHTPSKKGKTRPIKTNFFKAYAKKVFFDMLTKHKNFNDKNFDCPFLKDKQGVETKLKNTIEIYKECNSS